MHLYYIKNSVFEDYTSNDLGAVITNLVDATVRIEFTKLTNILSTSNASPYVAGAIYKNKGALILERVCFDYCSTSKYGNNAGGNILTCTYTTTNISRCILSHSSPKIPSLCADCPLFYENSKNDFILSSNFTHNNGNNDYGNVFLEISYTSHCETKLNNFVNGSAMLFEQYYKPKTANYIRRCNVIDLVVTYIVAADTELLYLIECAFFRNSKGTIVAYARFQNCWSDDNRICSPAVKFTYLPNNLDIGYCDMILKYQQSHENKMFQMLHMICLANIFLSPCRNNK